MKYSNCLPDLILQKYDSNEFTILKILLLCIFSCALIQMRFGYTSIHIWYDLTSGTTYVVVLILYKSGGTYKFKVDNEPEIGNESLYITDQQ